MLSREIFLRICIELPSNVILKRPTMEFHYCAKLCIKNIPSERQKAENLNRWNGLSLEWISMEESRLGHERGMLSSNPMNSSHSPFFLHLKIPVCVRCECVNHVLYELVYSAKAEVYSKLLHFVLPFCLECGWNHGNLKSVRFIFKYSEGSIHDSHIEIIIVASGRKRASRCACVYSWYTIPSLSTKASSSSWWANKKFTWSIRKFPVSLVLAVSCVLALP